MKKTILSIGIVLVISNIQAQTYYGKNSFGRLQMISDSICTATFISWETWRSIDSCYIRKHGDTIFLSTDAQWRYKVHFFDKIKIHPRARLSAIMKVYQYSFPDKEY